MISAKVKILYLLCLAIFVCWTYTQVNPNLVLSSNTTYWHIQELLWHIAATNRVLLSILFVGITTIWYVTYLHLIKANKSQLVQLFVIIAAITMFSYPGLSNDVFNYLMNGKIQIEYHQSPYTYPPMHFAADPWLSFLHNVHTTSPYGYLWHAIEVFSYTLAAGHLQTGVIILRIINLISIGLAGWAILILTNNIQRVSIFILNPLIIIEGITNIHNDIVMMTLLICSLAIYKKYSSLPAKGSAILLWGASVLTKTITIIHPLILLIAKVAKRLNRNISTRNIAPLAYAAIMVLDGARRYFSWYWIWPFTMIPLSDSKTLRNVGILTTYAAILSYIPYLTTGTYSPSQNSARLAIVFTIPLLYIGSMYSLKKFEKLKT